MLNKNKKKTEPVIFGKDRILSEMMHYILDEKVTHVIHKNYFSHAEEIEMGLSQIALNKKKALSESSAIDKLISVKLLVRDANERANKILGTNNYEFNNIFKEYLALTLSVSIKRVEEGILAIITNSLKKEIALAKYITDEEIGAVGQYFKEQSCNLGLEHKVVAKIIDDIITQKIADDKLANLRPTHRCGSNAKPGELGKAVIKDLRDRNLISKEIIEKSLGKATAKELEKILTATAKISKKREELAKI